MQAQEADRGRTAQPADRNLGLGSARPVLATVSGVSDDPLRSSADIMAAAGKDPIQLLESALEAYERWVRDYTCTFRKQERIGETLRAEQVMTVSMREKPFSVMMAMKTPGKADRVIFVEGQNDGKLVARPSGKIARLFARSVKLPIDGPRAAAFSRRRIDQFGFRKALELALQYHRLARERGHATEVVFEGESTVNERPAVKIVRKLPDDATYPDQALEIYLDKELLLPLLLICRDGAGRLLGRYAYSDLRLNVGLTDRDFHPATHGM